MIDAPGPDQAQAGVGLHFVKVINRNGFALPVDYFDGVPYKFPAGEPQSIPADAAAHFFGYPAPRDQMKLHTCRRYGWNTPEMITPGPDGTTQADRYFDKLELKPVIYELVEKKDDPTAPIAADPGDDVVRQMGVRTPTEMLAPTAERLPAKPRERRQPRRFEQGAAPKAASE